MAKRIPGKEEFHETLRYFGAMLDKAWSGTVQLVHAGDARKRWKADWDHVIVVLATGVTPRRTGIPGEDPPQGARSYVDVLVRQRRGRRPRGDHRRRWHRVRCGRIPGGSRKSRPTSTRGSPNGAWTMRRTRTPGALREPNVPSAQAARSRSANVGPASSGRSLGKTTGWIHRAQLKHAQRRDAVELRRTSASTTTVCTSRSTAPPGCSRSITSWCARGRSPTTRLAAPLRNAAGYRVHVIGGADEARELDAKRAIDQGARLAASL